MTVMQPLRELATPLADISQPMPFHAVQTAFDPFFPMGKLQSYWKAQNLATLSDEAIDTIADSANHRPSPVTLVVTFHMGGAINRVGATETAYAERSALWMSSIDGNWENPADNAKNIAWVRESFNKSRHTPPERRIRTLPVKLTRARSPSPLRRTVRTWRD